jgi:predicted Zn-dependent protease
MIAPRLRSAQFLLALLLLASALAGCATAPGTGRTFFTGGMSAEQEARLGAEEHEKIVPAFGGVYADPALSAYVSSIGNLLAQTSETPELRFTFTVLDTPLVNAFALPGGYVYITRGLMALADDEAELAGVLAHEIGHVTARHTAERYGQGVAATLINIGAGLLIGDAGATQALGTVSTLALRSFSREQEYEADLLGVRYLTRAGYDPAAMASFLNRLRANSRLQAEMRGTPGKADAFDFMATHPRTADRIAQAVQAAGTTEVRDPMRPRDIYLKKIDGLLYGDSPEQGFIRGRQFLHPKLHFAFEVPAGFRLFNSTNKVFARGPEEAVIIFDRARKPTRDSMPAYLTRVWAPGVNLQNVEAITVNGMPAATGWTRVATRAGPREIRLVAFRYDAATIYRMLFVTPPELTGPLSPALRTTTYSFRRLSAAEAAVLKPLRLGLHRVGPGETVATLARRMPFEDYRIARFVVLNGWSEDRPLPAGRTVKLVTE